MESYIDAQWGGLIGTPYIEMANITKRFLFERKASACISQKVKFAIGKVLKTYTIVIVK